MNTLDALDAQLLRTDIPAFRPGDTLKVHVKGIAGTRSRVQIFQGVVIRRQGSGARETFTVHKISFGVGVERTFPVHSPNLERIELFTRGDVRRAKLYYLRELRGKKAKIKEKREVAKGTLMVTFDLLGEEVELRLLAEGRAEITWPTFHIRSLLHDGQRSSFVTEKVVQPTGSQRRPCRCVAKGGPG